MAPKEKMFDIDAAAIRELAEIMDETGLTEIEVAEGERSIRVARGHAGPAPVHHMHAPPPTPHTPPDAPIVTSVGPAAQHPGSVTSPMVGTAYLRPDPSSPPFVTVGSTVSVGDTLLIIEAMKVMNPIKATRGGKVIQVAVSDSQPVEFGEVLLIVE